PHATVSPSRFSSRNQSPGFCRSPWFLGRRVPSGLSDVLCVRLLREAPLPQVKVRYLALTGVNHSWRGQSGAGRWRNLESVIRKSASASRSREVPWTTEH